MTEPTRAEVCAVACADTGTIANLGVGVDYQVDAGDIMVGVVADSAIASDASLSSTDDHVFSATVVNYGLTAGVNLGRWKLPRWRIAELLSLPMHPWLSDRDVDRVCELLHDLLAGRGRTP